MSIYQIVYKAVDANNQQIRNVHHYEFFNYVPTTAELQETVDGIDSAYKTHLINAIDNGFLTYAYDVRRVDQANLPTIEYVPTAGVWFGSNTNNPLPGQLAALVTFSTTTTFPRTTRSYISGLTVADVDTNSQMTLSLQGLLQNWGTAMLSIPLSGALDPDKQAVKYGGTPRVVIDSNDVISREVTLIWATQRRRRIGVGA